MRKSAFIRRQQATNFAPAIRLAEKTGRPLNYLVTLNYSDTACAPADVSAAFARLRDNYFGPWYRRPRKGVLQPAQPAAFIWVIENTSVIAAHWLVHIPDGRLPDFKIRIEKWFEKTTGGIHFAANALDIRGVYNVAGARLYMLKGIDPLYGPFYGVRPVDQGVVHGKRFGFSESLGRSKCRESRTYHRQMVADRAAPKIAA